MAKFIHAIYDDDDKLLDAVKDLKENKVTIEEVFTPFPVHGLDHVMGLSPTSCLLYTSPSPRDS